MHSPSGTENPLRMGSGKKKHRPQKSMPNVGSLTRENSAAAKPKRRLSMLAASISRRKPTEFTSEEKVEGGEKESFGNWPNSEGFEVFRDELAPVELKVTGEIPRYALGILYRTGPGGYSTKTDFGTTISMSHWFDAFAQVHRFNLVSPTRVLYNSRHTCDGVLAEIRQTGQLPAGFSFAQRRDPCQSLFKKFMATFEPRRDLVCGNGGGVKNAAKVNICVTLSTDYPGIPSLSSPSSAHSKRSETSPGKAQSRRLYSKTDATVLQELDPETLEPIGLANQSMLHPELTGACSAAHARTDPVTGDIFNYNLTLGRTCIYKVFQVCKGSGEATILATITDAPGAYIHSFFLTERYVVLCVWGAHYGFGGLKVLYHKNLLDAIDPWDPAKPSRWYVIDRTSARRGVVSTHHSEPFFAFHSINAWEDAEAHIIAEIPAYDNLDILKKFYLKNIKGDSTGARAWSERGRPRFTRWKLSPMANRSEAVKVFQNSKDSSLELPSINPRFVTRPHRYTYGLLNRVKSTLADGIVKFDSTSHTWKVWEKHAHTPGECVFVPDPNGTDEDDGVLLSVVLDGFSRKSYLLCLSARDLSEIARAEMDTAVGFGFHGKHVGSVDSVEY